MLQNKRNKNLALIGGIGASIVMAIMGISVYYGVNPGIKGLFAAIVIFSVFEILVILAAITLFNPYAKGVLRSFAALVLVGCISMEIFVTANEMQGGVLKKMESAKAAETTSSNAATANSAMVQAQRGITDCNARFPRPKTDKTKREECSAPFNNALVAAQNSQGEVVAFSADNAAERSKWQAIADWYNADKLANEKITPDQAAFFVFMFLGILISFGKVFLYAIYGSEGNSSSDPVPLLPPTGTDTDSKDSSYRSSKVGFNSPAPVPAASSKSSVSNSVSRAYPAQNTHRVERIQSVSTAPRASVSTPVVTMSSPSGAQAIAAQRWHMGGNTALQAYPDDELQTKNELNERTSTLALSVAELDTPNDGYAQWLEDIQAGRCDTLIRDTKQWVQDHGYVEVGKTKQAQKLAEEYFAKAEQEGRIRVIDGWKSGMARKYEWVG